MKQAPSLARQQAVLLGMAFVCVETLVVILLVLLVLLPLGRRSADDLAGLMVLSAQTWSELPPQTRPAFEIELMHSHALALRDEPPGPAHDGWHAPYFFLLEQALADRTGFAQHLSREQTGDDIWYWARIPGNGHFLSVGLSAARLDSQPVTAILVALILAFLMAIGVAVWLARRLTRPLAQLEAASALIGQGGNPAMLPETGPREMIALSRRFNAMAQQVRDLLNARTTLLAGVSHDLRTPLARMRLALEMLKNAPKDSLITRMERDIDQMNQLIGQVLDLARGLNPEPVQALELRDFLNQIAAEYSTSEQAVICNCPDLTVTLARNALYRALSNLLQNAQRYAPGHTVELVAHTTANGLRVGVLDRGPGIAAEQIENMFLPFQRLEPSRSPITGGMGLGLSIVRELCRVNGWHVELKERPGGGLQAWIEMDIPSPPSFSCN